jgi:hypothetical protein
MPRKYIPLGGSDKKGKIKGEKTGGEVVEGAGEV